VDTLHLVAAEALGSVDTPAPTTGLLFTAIYNITGTSPAAGISVGFQTGCSHTSVSPNVCVSISNGEGVLEVETVQTGTGFNNSNAGTMASIVVSANQTSFGPEFPGVSNAATITATAKNGYPAGAPDAVTFTSVASTGLTATFTGVNPCTTGGTSCPVSLSLSAASAGTYSVTVYGTYASLDPSGHPDTLASTVTLSVVVNDFSFAVSPTTVSFISGEIGIATATLTSLNGFAGSATLSIGVISPGLTISFSPNPVVLTSGGTATSRITYKASPAVATTYHATIKATIGTQIKTSAFLTTSVSAPVPDFYLIATPDSIGPIDSGVSASSTITATYVNGFTSSVALSAASSPTGMTTTLNQTSVTTTHNATLTVSATAGGSYTVAVTGNSGTLVHTVTVGVIVNVNSQAPDFSIAAIPTQVAAVAGVIGTSTVTITSAGGFNSDVFLSTLVPVGLSCSLGNAFVIGSGTSTLSCSGSTGTYKTTVTGTSGPLFHSVDITFTFTAGVQGLVCIATQGATSCPASPLILSGPAPSPTNQLRVSVLIQDSNGLDGFDITLLANHAILKPAGVDTTGTVLQGAISTLSNCIGGIGTGCSATDNVDTIHSALVASFLTSPPTTGLLFTAIYNITGTTTETTIGYQSGCARTSVSGGLCVGILNGSTLPDSENGQTAFFSNTPFFIISTNPANLSVPRGNSSSSIVNIQGISGFLGTVTLGVSVTPLGPTSSLSSKTLIIGPASSNETQLNIVVPISASTGAYNITITATSGSLSNNKIISLTVPSPNFSISAGPPSLTLNVGTSSTTTVTVLSIAGFSGTVALATSMAPVGLFSILQISSLTLGSGKTNSTILTINTNNATQAGTYLVTITGTVGSVSHSTVLTVNIADFGFSIKDTIITLAAGNSAATLVQISSRNSFTGTVSITSFTPTGITALFGGYQTVVVPLTPGTIFAYVLTISSRANMTAGPYVVVVTATGPTSSHSQAIFVTIAGSPPPPPSNFSIAVNPNLLSLFQGTGANTTVTISGVNGFKGNVNFTLTVPAGLSAKLQHSTLAFPSMSSTILTVATTKLTPPGVYGIAISATNGTLTRFDNLQLIVNLPPAPDFTISTNPGLLSIQAGNNGSSTIGLTSLNGFQGNLTLSFLISAAPFNGTTIIPGTTITIQPNHVHLLPGGSVTSTLSVTTSRTTPASFYNILVQATNGTFAHSVFVTLQVRPPPDVPPVANFTFNPNPAIVGQNVAFDGSSSFDPDGFIQSWSWSFGDGFGSCCAFTNHQYFSTGNYTVTLTVTDNAGFSSVKIENISVIPRPAHDVAIAQVYVQPTSVVSTQIVFINAELINTGSSNETVSVTAYANGHPIQTLRGIFLRGCGPFNFCGFSAYVTIRWDTTGVAAGNYSLTVTVFLPVGEVDPTPADNTVSAGTIMVFPAPVIRLSPSSGPIGTKVLVQGSGFPLQGPYGFQSTLFVYVNYDNMSTGFTFATNGTFTFTFDVPLSQPGSHGIFAYDPYGGAHASATFTVQPTPNNNLVVSVNMGTIYFPGDTAVAYVLTTLNGAPVGPQNVQLYVILFKPDGTNVTLTTQRIGTGLYKVSYAIPSTGSLGTYLVLAKAHQQGPLDSSALGSFEVKPTWLSSNSGRITVGAATLAGLIGLVTVAWKKGYLRRKNGEEPIQPFQF
jgi:uncharacterized membrane protein